MTKDEKALRDILDALIDVLGRKHTVTRLAWTLTVGAVVFQVVTRQGDRIMVVVPNSSKAQMSIAPQDSFGNPARIDGLPQWGSSDTNLGDLVAAADGLSAEFIPSGPLGSLQVQVTADADLGEGVKTLTGLVDIQVEAGEAVSLAVNTTVVPK